MTGGSLWTGEAPCRARATCCQNTLRASSFPQSGDPTSGVGPVVRRAVPSCAVDTRWSRGVLVHVWSWKSRAGRPAVVAFPGAAPDRPRARRRQSKYAQVGFRAVQ